MNYKPNEQDLIDYLYGEADGKTKGQIEDYFQQHPGELNQLRLLQDVRSVMAQVGDKEVIAPPVFMDDKQLKGLWRSNFFRIPLGIAAAFLLMVLGARLIGLEMTISGNELKIGFGGVQEEQQAAPALSPQQIQAMIEQSLSRNNESIANAWEETQKNLDRSIKQNMAVNSKRIDDLVKATATASQDDVRQFVSGLRNENLQLMQDYMKLSSGEQRQYIESLLVDFSDYLKEQRNKDMQLFETKVSSLEQDNNQFRQETAQILTSLIGTGGSTSTLKRN